MDLRALHRRLHQMRLEAGLSVDEMARRVGISPMTVDRVESGSFTLSVATVADWAAVCGLRADFSFEVDTTARPSGESSAGLSVTDALPGALARVSRSRSRSAAGPDGSTPQVAMSTGASNTSSMSAPPGQPAPLRQPARAAHTATEPALPREEPPSSPGMATETPTSAAPLALRRPQGSNDSPGSATLFGSGPFRTGGVINKAPIAETPTSAGWGHSVTISGARSAAFEVPAEYDPYTTETAGTMETDRPVLRGLLPRVDATEPTAHARRAKPPRLTSGGRRTTPDVIPPTYTAQRRSKPTADAAAAEDGSVGRAQAPEALPRTADGPTTPEVMGALRSAIRQKPDAEPPPPEPDKGVLRGLVGWFTGTDDKKK